LNSTVILLIIIITIKYTLINFTERNNIYNTNHNIFSINIINYYKNNIIYNSKNNNTFYINTINYTKIASTKQTIIFLLLTL
jgi:uncharacterized lipoprotein YehR (DUF1307 family)